MHNYSKEPLHIIKTGAKEIASFTSDQDENIEWSTVESFGEEWRKFHEFDDSEVKKIGDQYFDIVTPIMLNDSSSVLDIGCGSGRWSRYLAKRVKEIEAIDPSNAVFQALKLTEKFNNVRVTKASVDSIPFEDESFDFVFSLGVLHHIPDTEAALIKSVAKVKQGGFFLVYLYYNLDNRSLFFKGLFILSNIVRIIVSRLPGGLKRFSCEVLAIMVYMPFILFSKILYKLPKPFRKLIRFIPLSYYHNRSFQIIRNDSLDRFGTPLENRFSKERIKTMMEQAGLVDVSFSNHEPYWHAVGKKK